MKIAETGVRTPGDAHATGAVDALLRSPSSSRSPMASCPVGPPIGAAKRDLAAEAGNRHRGVGGAAAADGDELAGLRPCCRAAEIADAEHLVENRDARAEDVRHVRRGSGRLRPRPG